MQVSRAGCAVALDDHDILFLHLMFLKGGNGGGVSMSISGGSYFASGCTFVNLRSGGVSALE